MHRIKSLPYISFLIGCSMLHVDVCHSLEEKMSLLLFYGDSKLTSCRSRLAAVEDV